MRILLAVAITFAASLSMASEFSQKSCEQYSRNASYSKALDVVSSNMNSSRSELCSLERLMDVYVTNRVFFNMETQKDEPHVWVTLHYAEHSCQYFVREADSVVTRKNCYNTVY